MFRYLTVALLCVISLIFFSPSHAVVSPERERVDCGSGDDRVVDRNAIFFENGGYQTFLVKYGLCLDGGQFAHLDTGAPFFDDLYDGAVRADDPALSEDDKLPEITYDVPVVVNERVEYFINYFQTRGRGFFTRWLSRSTKYMPMVQDILRQNELPEDLAYLALIESGFNTRAYSRAKAVGIWQFMLWTGRRYDLRIDWWIDERRNPEKSTRAAAAYLKNLYSMFDSWYLAAAGYNGGEGRVKRAIRKHKTDDFWVMSKQRRGLKRETKDYIPKFIAAMMIAKEPEKYGFTDIDYSPPLEYDKVNIPEATDLRVIARASGATVRELNDLNPELKRWFTPPNYPEYEIKLPKGKGETLLKNLPTIPRQERLKFLKHKVRKGDTLLAIARRYGTTVKPIVFLNEIKNPRFIREGWLLVVPVRAETRRRAKVERAPLPSSGVYKVQRGDTLWEISLRFGVKVEQLLKWNEIERVDRLMPGQRLYVKQSKT